MALAGAARLLVSVSFRRAAEEVGVRVEVRLHSSKRGYCRVPSWTCPTWTAMGTARQSLAWMEPVKEQVWWRRKRWQRSCASRLRTTLNLACGSGGQPAEMTQSLSAAEVGHRPGEPATVRLVRRAEAKAVHGLASKTGAGGVAGEGLLQPFGVVEAVVAAEVLQEPSQILEVTGAEAVAPFRACAGGVGVAVVERHDYLLGEVEEAAVVRPLVFRAREVAAVAPRPLLCPEVVEAEAVQHPWPCPEGEAAVAAQHLCFSRVGEAEVGGQGRPSPFQATVAAEVEARLPSVAAEEAEAESTCPP